MWSWLLNPRFGWINQGIRFVYDALDPVVRWHDGSGTSDWPLPQWLYSPFWCKPALILIHAWSFGGAMLVFLAALRRIPSQIHEAAVLDGAGAGSRFLHVTLPIIAPVILFNAAVGFVFAMQSFSDAYLLRTRQQLDGLLFYMLNVYQVVFEPPHRLG